MKKYIVYIIMGLLMLQLHISSYAGEWSQARDISTVSEFNGERQSRVTGMPRGRLISSIELQLTDKGRGTAGVYADLLCHEPMKQLRMWIFLEKWDEVQENWAIIDDQEFIWLAEEYPDQDLTMAMVGYEVSGLQRGQYYRLRGLFGAYDLDSSLQEAWQTTSGDLYFE